MVRRRMTAVGLVAVRGMCQRPAPTRTSDHRGTRHDGADRPAACQPPRASSRVSASALTYGPGPPSCSSCGTACEGRTGPPDDRAWINWETARSTLSNREVSAPWNPRRPSPRSLQRSSTRSARASRVRTRCAVSARSAALAGTRARPSGNTGAADEDRSAAAAPRPSALAVLVLMKRRSRLDLSAPSRERVVRVESVRADRSAPRGRSEVSSSPSATSGCSARSP